MDSSNLFLSVLFGSVGTGYFIYGKRQGKPVPLLVGVALCIYPYLVSNLYLMVAIGILLIVLPYFVRT